MTEPVTAVASFLEPLSSMRVSRTAHFTQASRVVHSSSHGTPWHKCALASGGP